MANLDERVINTLVPAPGKKFRILTLFLPVAIVSIYSMFFPLLMMDISITVYQWIYFSVMGIPKIRKNQYIHFERWDLSKLSLMQKVNCVYCEYANGILAYAKAVGNQTEIYSCAIKHRNVLKGHEHEKVFYSEKKFI